MIKALRLHLKVFFCFLLLAISLRGFAQAPVISSFAPGEGAIGTLVTVKGSQLNTTRLVTIGGVNALVVSQSATQLTAMVMPGAVTGNVVVDDLSGHAVMASATFNVKSTAIPNKQQAAKFNSPAGATGMGYSVAISADGNTAILGAAWDYDLAGSACIFVRNNGVWSQQRKLTPNTPSASFGLSVAISADGNTAVVGAAKDNYNIGAVFIFIRTGTTWAQQGAKLVGSGYVNYPGIGSSVSISADGNTVVAGGWNDNSSTGATWVFNRNGSTWAQAGNKLVGTGSAAYGLQGKATAISADGKTLATGGLGDNNGTGAVWIFTLSSKGEWQQQGKLAGAGSTLYASQGSSIALNADGTTLLIGAPGDRTNAGSAWVFTLTGGTWVQQGSKLIGTGIQGSAYFGTATALSADGNVAVITANEDNARKGAAWVFARKAGAWQQQGDKLVANDAYGEARMGTSCAISADGSTALFGSPWDDGRTGAGWAFTDTTYVMPVTLKDVKAYAQNKGIMVEWQGYNEINMRAYNVEKSTDGYTFTSVASIQANNNNLQQNAYSWFDASILNGPRFYRIKAVSKDGGLQYSYIVKVNTGNGTTGINVYPNPVSNKRVQVNFNNMAAGNYNVTIYTTTGQKIYSTYYTHGGGSTSATLPLNNIAAGIYYIHVSAPNKEHVLKILVK